MNFDTWNYTSTMYVFAYAHPSVYIPSIYKHVYFIQILGLLQTHEKCWKARILINGFGSLYLTVRSYLSYGEVIQIPSILGYCFYLGALLCRTSSCVWLQTLVVADVMTQSRQEDSDFCFFISDLPPGMFWQGGYHFKLNVNVEAFQSYKLQRFLSVTQRNKVLCMLITCCGGRMLGIALVLKSIVYCFVTNLDTRSSAHEWAALTLFL